MLSVTWLELKAWFGSQARHNEQEIMYISVLSHCVKHMSFFFSTQEKRKEKIGRGTKRGRNAKQEAHLSHCNSLKSSTPQAVPS